MSLNLASNVEQINGSICTLVECLCRECSRGTPHLVYNTSYRGLQLSRCSQIGSTGAFTDLKQCPASGYECQNACEEVTNSEILHVKDGNDWYRSNEQWCLQKSKHKLEVSAELISPHRDYLATTWKVNIEYQNNTTSTSYKFLQNIFHN